MPLEKLVCVTGPSGSGKSSLAFDTLYAEGHRRYVESLSTYARQFFDKIPKPEVDSIENICPSIALEQRNPVKNSRSTLGTSTEIYDYLRLLFSKTAEAFCPNGHGEIRSDSPQTAAETLLIKMGDQGERLFLGFVSKEAVFADHLIERGFLRMISSGKKPEPELLEDKRGCEIKAGSLVVIDRLVLREKDRIRLVESLEAAFQEGSGEAFVFAVERNEFFRFSSRSACGKCGEEVPAPSPLLFSFNSPVGACETCKGFGNVLKYDEALIIPNKRVSLAKGAIEPFTKKMMRAAKRKLVKYLEDSGIDTTQPYASLSRKEQKAIWSGEGKWPGVRAAFEKMEAKKYKLHVRVFLRRYQSSFECPECHGSRLKPESLYFQVGQKTIFDLVMTPLGELYQWFEKLKMSPEKMKIAEEVLRQLKSRLYFLNRLGLQYLNLHRLAKTLSGGETQRINLANQLGSELSGSLYVLDEPSIGLHSVDRDRLLDSLEELVNRGNSVIVVEHDLETIRKADEVIELGPESGERGGELVFQGNQKAFSTAKTLTAGYLRGELEIAVPKERRTGSARWLSVQGAKENNLQDVSLNLPLNRFIGISGVSGSGKSTLIHKTLHSALARLYNKSTEPIGRFEKIFGADLVKGVSLLDQSPIGRSSRSIPLSVIGGYDEVRKIFAQTPEAKRKGFTAAHFSFNVGGGRCETCQGEGFIKTEMYFLDDLFLPCEDCAGRRFKRETLDIRFKGKSIHDVLQMSVREAKSFFAGSKSLVTKFIQLENVGLHYLKLGQSSKDLSGGESQRLKIASEVANVRKRGVLYILDEPSTGLHMNEIALLIRLMNDLVEQGNTVVVIEHQLDILKCVDWLIDLGPGAGVDGGKIVGESVPEDVARLKTPTGEALKALGL